MPADASERHETLLTLRWPSIGATRTGRWVGRLGGRQQGFTRIFTLGNLLAVLTIPVTLLVYFWQLAPGAARRYGLTDRRVVVYRGLRPAEERSIGLEEFDTIDVEVLPGQRWLHCGELVFRRGGREVFRLPGVSRPEALRQTCLKTRRAMLGVGDVLARQRVAG
jgi:hypothetical protein